MNCPQVMDWMWAYFFATGKKKAIERLVTVLDYAKYQGSVDAYKNSEKTDEDKQKAIYDAMFQAALWSLQSNAQNYKLVKKYLEEIVQEKTLTENEHLWLFFILSKIDPQKYKIKIGK